MGANIVSRLLRGGHQCVVFDMNPATVQRLVNEGAIGTSSLDEFEEGCPSPVLSAALYRRFSSRGEDDFAEKVLSAMRFEFGGHAERSHGG